MTLRLGDAVRVHLPDQAAWSRHVEQLERRAATLRDPLDIARQHHQRARVLADDLGRVEAAIEAWQAALAAQPGYLPAMLALRDHALIGDRRALAVTLTDTDLPALADQAGADAGEVVEMATFFALVWLFRWPDAERAATVLTRLAAAGDPRGLADRLAHLCLDGDDWIVWLERRVARLDGAERAPVLAELGRVLVNTPDRAAEGWAMVAESAEHDPVAAWYRVEQALLTGESGPLARALETLGARCPDPGGAIARFLAAELYELVLDDVRRAHALYGTIDGGGLQAAVALKLVLADARQFADDPLAMSATLAEQAAQIGDSRLEAVLLLRAAQLAALAGDLERARAQARSAHDRWPEDERSRDLVERSLWLAAPSSPELWHVLRRQLTEDARSGVSRALRAALLEHALSSVDEALEAVGPASTDPRALLFLRARQRLLGRQVTGTTPEAAEAATERVRAWQIEANLLDAGERRADLYLRIGRFYLEHTAQTEKALTYLFWVLDRDPDHLTALRILEHVCRGTGRQRPLVQVLRRTLNLLDRPVERFPLRRELAAAEEALGADVDTCIALFRAALTDEPTDAETLRHLERIYRQHGRFDELRALLEEAMRAADGPLARAEIGTRLGPLLVDRFNDAIGALRLYDRVTPDCPPGPLRSRLEMLQTEAAAAGGLSGSLPALRPDELADMDVGRPDFDFGLDDIDELLTVVSEPVASSSSAVAPPLPPLMPMAPTEIDTGSGHGISAEDSVDDPFGVLAGPLTDTLLDGEAPAPPISNAGLFDSPRAGAAAPIDAGDAFDFEFEVDEDDGDLSGSVELSPEDLIDLEDEAPTAPAMPAVSPPTATPPPAPIADRTTGFLGEERARPARSDPGRAIIARKLRRSRGQAAEESFPDFDDGVLIEAVTAYNRGSDANARVEAASTMGRRYEELGHPLEAIRAWRAVLSFRAGHRQAVTRLDALYRATEDWKGLVSILGGEATRTGDPSRRQTLLVEMARLEWRALDDPKAAVDHFLEALDLGPIDAEIIAELSDAVREVRRWPAYVDALARGGLDDPETMSPDQAIHLGRVHLYELEDATRAVPYLLQAARSLPERVDIAADLAEARAALGEVDRAVALLEKAIAAGSDLEPSARNVLRLRLARLYEAHAADPGRALAVYRDALGDGLSDPPVLDRIEHLATGAGDHTTLALIARRNLDEARTRGAEAEELRPLAIRLGHLQLKQLDQPREAASAFVEAYALDPSEEDLFRLVDGILRKHPDPALQSRLYAAWLDDGERTLRQRLEMSLRLVAAYEAEGRLDDAAKVLEDLQSRLPTDREVLAALERVYQKADRWADLIEMFQARLHTVIQTEERLGLIRRVARAYEVGLRDLPRATEVYQTLLEEQPEDATALRAVARLLEAQRRWSDLLEISERELALTDKPRQKAFILFRMGSLYESQLDDPESATARYRAALEMDPRCFPALHGLREIAARAEDWATVIDYLRRELGLWDEPKERAAVLSRIAELYATRLDDQDGALRHYREAIEVYPSCVPAARVLAEEAFGRGDYAAAAPLYQVLSNQNVDKLPRAVSSALFFRRGVVARHLGRQLEAIESFKLSLEFDPDNAEALHALVESYTGEAHDHDGLTALLQQLDTAFAEHEAAGRLDEMTRIDVLRGVAAEHQLRLADAQRYYQRAVERHPHDPEVLRPLVELALRMRDWPAATGALQQFIDGLAPMVGEDELARQRVIDALVWQGEIWCDMAVDPPRAVACYEQVAALSDDDRDAAWRVAQCQYLMGAFDDAAVIIETLLGRTDISPAERARFTFYAGRIAEVGQADPERAYSLYGEALAIDPHCAAALLGACCLLGSRADSDALIALLGEHQALVEAPAVDPDGAALKTFAAGVLHRHGQRDAALRLLAPLAEGRGIGARDARFTLARVHGERDEFDAAARWLYQILADDICDLAALRALADVRQRQGDEERLFQVLSVLELFGGLTAEQRQRFMALADRNRKQRDRGGRTVPDAALDVELLHPSFRSPLVPLVGMCDVAFAGKFEQPRPTLRRAEQVNGRRHTFTLELRLVQTLLGYRDFDLYFVGDHPELVAIWPGQPPLVALGAPALGERCTTAERLFLVGRAAFYSKTGLSRLHDLGPERAVELVSQVAGLFVRPDEHALLDQLPERESATVKSWLERLGADRQLPAAYSGESLVAGVAHTADRAGLLACGPLRAAVEMLTRHVGFGESIEPGDDLAWAVRSGSRLRDLVKYALSDAYIRLRKTADLAL